MFELFIPIADYPSKPVKESKRQQIRSQKTKTIVSSLPQYREEEEEENIAE